MEPQNIIIRMLECHFRNSEIDAFVINGLCNLFISGLTNTNFERTPNFDDLEKEIIALALVVSSDTSYDSGVIEEDLWTILENWWDTVKWTRRQLRDEVRQHAHEQGRQEAEAEMETEDLIADLVYDIVQEIKDKGNAKTENIRENDGYRPHVLQALLQLHQTRRYTPFGKHRLPNRETLLTILGDYIGLSKKHNFGNDVHILLKFLLDKMKRNSKRHAFYTTKAYKTLCKETDREPSFDDFLQYRRLQIDPQLLFHAHRLVTVLYGIP